MITPVANSAKPITEAKKTTSRVSSTPRWKASKCVITENAAIVCVTTGFAKRVRRSVTGV
jgi:hypothetical protein